MKSIYFIASGFGFWYNLPNLFNYLSTESDYEFIGASYGSLLCIISILNQKYHNFV